MPSDGGKCPRCWRYKVEKAEADVADIAAAAVEADTEPEPVQPPLCSRCVVAVKEHKAKTA